MHTLPDDVSLEKEQSYFTMEYSAKFHDKWDLKNSNSVKNNSKNFYFYLRFITFFKSSKESDITDKDRIFITYEILSRTSFDANSSLTGIENLLQKKVFSHAFPLHDVNIYFKYLV